MTLLDYHRLRDEEERSWDRERLRQGAGTTFTAAAARLLPTDKWQWYPGQYMDVVRSAWFDKCLELCALYRTGTEPQRTWLRSRIERPVPGNLGVFGLRAAVLAAREHSPDLVRTSLVAFAIVDLTDHDIRDVLIGLSLLCHCANLSGADVPALLREAAAISGSAVAALYEDWAARYPGVQGIGSMGWRQVETGEGVGFRQG
jgi:hypothetical protein